MKRNWKRNWIKRIFILGLLLGLYPALVLGYTWNCVFKSGFEGGKNGPLDAYRHALASSVVSYTLGESAVNLVTTLLESQGRDTDRMDQHNNRIGAGIGSKAKSFADLEPLVRQSVLSGTVNAPDGNQITWLPEQEWRDARLW